MKQTRWSKVYFIFEDCSFGNPIPNYFALLFATNYYFHIYSTSYFLLSRYIQTLNNHDLRSLAMHRKINLWCFSKVKSYSLWPISREFGLERVFCSLFKLIISHLPKGYSAWNIAFCVLFIKESKEQINVLVYNMKN